MNRWQNILLIALLMTLFCYAPAPALAWSGDDAPPPLPGWLQFLLEWLGLVSTPTPAAPPAPALTPTPAIQEYRVTTLAQLEALPGQLTAGKRVRVWASSSDVQAIIADYLSSPAARKNGLQSGQVTLQNGFVQVSGSIERAFVEEQGIALPFGGDVLQVEGQGTMQVADCQPVVQLQKVTVNGVGLPLTALLNQMLNDALRKEWPAEICLDSLTISTEKIVAEGALR